MHRGSIKSLKKCLPIGAILLFVFHGLSAQNPPVLQLPLRQSTLDPGTAGPPLPSTLQDASRDDRWLGLGVSDVRWAPDGSAAYFRWNLHPAPGDDPDADPWFRVSRDGGRIAQVPESEIGSIPALELSWSQDGRQAAWLSQGQVWLYDRDASAQTRCVFSTQQPARNVRINPGGTAIHFMVGEDLYEFNRRTQGIRQVTRKFETPDKGTEISRWLQEQQQELFEVQRADKKKEDEAGARTRRLWTVPQPIPAAKGSRLEDIRLSPDARYVTFIMRIPAQRRRSTEYLDYVTRTGYAAANEARSKAGEPQDTYRMGIIRFDPAQDPDKVQVAWVVCKEKGDQEAVIYGPYWNPEGDRAAVQVISQGNKDFWISLLDLTTGLTTLIAHDHDDAWLGGPPPIAGRGQPGLMEWLPGRRLVFASERSGWSQLYLAEPSGEIRPLTSGPWEVRGATFNRYRTQWLITASREHPCDDHLYLMPAAGGDLVRLTTAEGRNSGFMSPDGERMALIRSTSVALPDLFLRDMRPGTAETRITMSGTDNYYRHLLVKPDTVSFPHPDGKPVWAAHFKPDTSKKNGAAIIHIHGGGYRQFSHHGWSVYGYSGHIGLINHLVGQGYTVLDFDYRGSAGFGRDYRTDIYRSMGDKDVSGAVAAVDYLTKEHGIDRTRVGIYGLSYGGFFTLMALFRHPGVFAAGVANAAVADWAHYSHDWTSRILNVPYEDPEAYRQSSPIYYSGGLKDPLLIVHGLIDDNVHFQDAARLVQKLIEEGKQFEVMYYPVERHVMRTESSRLDYVKRVSGFFSRYLKGAQ